MHGSLAAITVVKAAAADVARGDVVTATVVLVVAVAVVGVVVTVVVVAMVDAVGHVHMPSVVESLALPVGVPAAPLHCPVQSCAVWQSWTQSLQHSASVSSFRGQDWYLNK